MAKKKTEMELMKKAHTKQEIREINSYKRVVVTMNTGTMAFKSPKDYRRNEKKAELRRMINEY